MVEEFVLKTRCKLDLIYVISNMTGGGLGEGRGPRSGRNMRREMLECLSGRA